MTASSPYAEQPLAIVAGGGSLPIEIADSVVKSGGRVVVLAISGEADGDFRRFPHLILGIAQYGRAIQFLRSNRVRDVLLIGRILRPDVKAMRPDIGFVSVLPKVIRIVTAAGDDALLRTVISLFEPHGLRVVGVPDVAPELTAPNGAISAREPTSADFADAAVGLAAIKDLGAYDIGQAAIVRDGTIVALEGADGTDAMLARASMRGAHQSISGVLVKGAKPGQDLRVDLPTIGPGTIGRALDARLSGVAVESGFVLLAEREAIVAEAARCGVSVFGVASIESAARRDDDVSAKGVENFGVARRDADDAALGVNVMRVLSRHAEATCLAVRRRRVLAIGIAETAADVLARVHGRKTNVLRRRSGYLVVRDTTALRSSSISTLAAKGLRGLLVPADATIAREIAAACEVSRLDLVRIPGGWGSVS
jgi:DUF1009 family protein